MNITELEEKIKNIQIEIQPRKRGRKQIYDSPYHEERVKMAYEKYCQAHPEYRENLKVRNRQIYQLKKELKKQQELIKAALACEMNKVQV